MLGWGFTSQDIPFESQVVFCPQKLEMFFCFFCKQSDPKMLFGEYVHTVHEPPLFTWPCVSPHSIASGGICSPAIP